MANKHLHVADMIRNVLYPLVPALAIASVWTLAWARSMEAQTYQPTDPVYVFHGHVQTKGAAQQLRLTAEQGYHPATSSDFAQ